MSCALQVESNRPIIGLITVFCFLHVKECTALSGKSAIKHKLNFQNDAADTQTILAEPQHTRSYLQN